MTELVGASAAATWPYSAVVYVVATFEGDISFSGSGIMVGPNDVLTAAHVIYSADHGGLATNITVYPGADGQNLPYLSAVAQSVSYFEIFLDEDGLLSASASETDIALLGLTQNVGNNTGTFELGRADATTNFNLTGYPGLYADSTGARMTNDTGTGYTDGFYDLLFYNSDLVSNPGNSGGPIWYSQGGTNYVGGVVSTGGWGVDVDPHRVLLETWINQNDYLVNTPTSYDNTLIGGSSDEVLTGGSGVDLIRGNEGNDQIRGGGGNDVVYGNIGNDLIYGNQGIDLIRAGDGQNTIFGGQQNDQIIGGNDADIAYGNFQTDYLQGSGGNDILWGGQNNDTLQGDSGDDTLIGNRGDDTMMGGFGADLFRFNWASDQWHDVIIDFNQTQGDVIQITGLSEDVSWSYDSSSNQTILTDGVVHALLEIDGPTRIATQVGSGTNQITLVGDFSTYFASGWPDFIVLS